MSFTFEKEYGLLIGGEWVKAEKGETFATYTPATNELLSTCANASAADVDKAVSAAQKAFESWSRTSPQERAEVEEHERPRAAQCPVGLHKGFQPVTAEVAFQPCVAQSRVYFDGLLVQAYFLRKAY